MMNTIQKSNSKMESKVNSLSEKYQDKQDPDIQEIVNDLGSLKDIVNSNKIFVSRYIRIRPKSEYLREIAIYNLLDNYFVKGVSYTFNELWDKIKHSNYNLTKVGFKNTLNIFQKRGRVSRDRDYYIIGKALLTGCFFLLRIILFYPI